MIFDVKVNTNQIPVDVLAEGVNDFPAMSKIGQLFTADWHTRVILAGRAFRMSIGTIAGSSTHTLVGNGTLIDLDVPEGIVAVDSGYLVPMSLNLGLLCDTDAEHDVCEVLLTTDRATAISADEIDTATGTAEIALNMLDGADAFSGRVVSICTTQVTDPVHTDLLFYKNWEALESDPKGPTNFNVDKVFAYPTFLAGPCSLLLYFGGTVACTGMGSLTFAHIPTSWMATS